MRRRGGREGKRASEREHVYTGFLERGVERPRSMIGKYKKEAEEEGANVEGC